MSESSWYGLKDPSAIPTPALLVYEERLNRNLRTMIDVARSPAKLRPHVKTHKMAAVMARQLALGITRFKCATIAEVEMAAAAGAPDVLLAYQPVGPNIGRLASLRNTFPGTKLSVIVDDADAVRALNAAWSRGRLELLVDIDVGQHRTGVRSVADAIALYQVIGESAHLAAGGLHVYDGHITQSDVDERRAASDAAFEIVQTVRAKLSALSLDVPKIVAGGTPTFPFHAARQDVECSPGTTVFWDASYAEKVPDLPFIPAALVLSRVISKPSTGLLCLDLGHKAIASEMPHPRVEFLNVAATKCITHSEEHMVIEAPDADRFAVGDCVYGIPWHICPTVALHSEALVIDHGEVTARWTVTARNRRITI
ncbi:MAG TPA: D-TA family PLP-dependent enzyme [Chthoniobacteraceae bacterium]|nr:D-TA family PLP-dependent enzyme [Chthoniobacteraceae bacterium]